MAGKMMAKTHFKDQQAFRDLLLVEELGSFLVIRACDSLEQIGLRHHQGVILQGHPVFPSSYHRLSY